MKGKGKFEILARRCAQEETGRNNEEGRCE